MPSSNNFLERINRAASLFGLTERRIRAFAEGFVRGSFWLVIWSLIVAAALFISYYWIAPDIHLGLGDFIRSVVNSILQTGGGASSASAVGGIFESSKFFLEFAARPTALSLILGVMAYRRGRARQIEDSQNKSSESTALAYAVGLGSGFSALVGVASLSIAGIVGSAPYLTLQPASIFSLVVITALVGIPAWLGGLREQSSRRATSPWVWFYSALRTFTLGYFALILLALITVGLYFAIAPVFEISPAHLEVAGPLELNDQATRALLLGILGVLVLLPTLLFYVLSFGMGANLGLLTDFQGVNLLGAVIGMIPSQFSGSLGDAAANLGNTNLLNMLGWPAFVIAGILVALVALIAGASAAHKTRATVNFKKHFLVSLFATAASATAATYLTTLSVTWTNKGKTADELTTSGLALQSGYINYGTSAFSLVLICGLLAIFSTLGASTAKSFTSDAYPWLIRRLSNGASVVSDNRSFGSIFFGFITSLAVVAAVVTPLTIATIERTWALNSGPSSLINDLANALQKGDLNTTKKIFTTEETKYTPWLPDSVLKASKPKGEQAKNLELLNSHGDNWKVGQLDALGKLSWKVSDEKSVQVSLASIGKVRDEKALIKHADYKLLNTKSLLDFAAGTFLAPTGKANLKIAGESVTPGQYRALPGVYRITTDAYKLVAATASSVATVGELTKYVPVEKPSLKAEYKTVLANEINRLALACTKFTEINKSPCFTLEDIYNKRTDIGNKAPSAYFGFQTNSFKVDGFECGKSTSDTLLSALHVLHVAECSVEVKFTLDYFKSKVEVRNLSRQESYNGCPDFGAASCNRTRTISLGSEKVEVRGDKIGSADFTSKVPVTLSAIGYLDAKDKFAIIKTFVPPTYAPVKKVVVKPVLPDFEILGYYPTLEILKHVQTNPKVGDAYAVTAAHLIYVWTGTKWSEVK